MMKEARLFMFNMDDPKKSLLFSVADDGMVLNVFRPREHINWMHPDADKLWRVVPSTDYAAYLGERNIAEWANSMDTMSLNEDDTAEWKRIKSIGFKLLSDARKLIIEENPEMSMIMDILGAMLPGRHFALVVVEENGKAQLGTTAPHSVMDPIIRSVLDDAKNKKPTIVPRETE